MPAAIPFITSSNASELAKLSWERRRARPAAIPATAEPQQEANQDKLRAIARVKAQLERVDQALDVCIEAKDWDALTRSKERLFKAWVHLAGIPGPGQLKPVAPRPAKPSQVGPLE